MAKEIQDMTAKELHLCAANQLIATATAMKALVEAYPDGAKAETITNGLEASLEVPNMLEEYMEAIDNLTRKEGEQ